MSQQSQVAKIKYVKFVKAKRNYKTVSHEKLNDWTPSLFTKNGMFESLLNLEYVHLYFDFDFHTGDDIITNVKKITDLLDSFKNVFGEYAFAGYCCDKDLYNQLDKEFKSKIELKTINLDKPLSFHVVFYESRILQNELCEIMTGKKYDHEIKNFADSNVYKNKDKEQLLRHPYANKYGEPYKPNEQELKGVNFDNLQNPFMQSVLVATPKGSEKIIDKDQWLTLFNDTEPLAAITEDNKKDSFDNLIKEIESSTKDVKNEKEYKQAIISKELFDTIVNGFEGVEIHGESEDIEREIGVLQIITALNACENDEITKDDIEKALDYIERNGNLTSRAAERFGEICYRNRNVKADTWQQLFKMIRIHNKTYFNQNIVPIIDPKKQFIEGNYTFDKYLMNYTKFTTKYQHMNALAKCIAYNTKGGYIKKTTDNEGNIVYEVVKSDGELKCLCNRNFDIKASEAEIERMKEQKKKVVEVKSYNIVKFLKEADVSAKLNTFEGISLAPVNERTLWQYRSPNVKTYNKELIEDWIEFMKSRIVNERPFLEELYSHAYRLRNPSAFIEKFFIHFGSPNTGKSFLAACLANIYPSLANVAVNPNQTSDLFNSWLSTLLMVHMEEADTDNYRNKDFEQFVKRITTINGSARAMYRETKAVRNSAIVGMNTNDPNLYGLTRSDEATKTRLVIIEFKDNNLTSKEWANVREKYIDNADFAYSLYKYLSEELEIPSTFNLSRYNGEEKYEFINKACANNKNSLELWFDSIVEDARFASYEDCKNGTAFYYDFEIQTNKKSKIQYVFQTGKWFTDSYEEFCKSKRFKFNENSVIKFIEEKGFEYAKNPKRGYRIEKVKFDAFRSDDVEINEEEDEWE